MVTAIVNFSRPFDISAFNIFTYEFCLQPQDTVYFPRENLSLGAEELFDILMYLKGTLVCFKFIVNHFKILFPRVNLLVMK